MEEDKLDEYGKPKCGFYFVTSKEYDRDIDILSEDRKFNAYFDRKSEPGLLEVFDSFIEKQENGSNYIKTLMKIGDYLYLDSIDIKQCIEQKEENKNLEESESEDSEEQIE